MLYKKIWLSGAILAAAALPAGGGAAEKPQVLLETSAGNIVIELFPDKAPESVRNFLAYVESRYYDGLIFHRVIPGFMIQGGGFKPGMEQRESTRGAIRNEADNGLRNRRGAVAMARTSDPHSATAQFFINLVDNAFLDHTAKTPRGWGYAVFGQVIEGLETVDKIAQADTARAGPHGDVPVEDIVIRRATLATAEAEGAGAAEPKP